VATLMTVRAARAATLEARAGASASGTAALGSAATIVTSTIASTAAIWPLKSRAWIAAANARGIARKILARLLDSANAWRAGFPGQENGIVFNRGESRRGCRGCFDRLVLGHFTCVTCGWFSELSGV